MSSIFLSICRLIVLLYNIWLYLFGKKVWYFIVFILYIDDIISFVLVLLLYFFKVVLIIFINCFLCFCYFIGKENFLVCFIFVLNFVVFL